MIDLFICYVSKTNLYDALYFNNSLFNIMKYTDVMVVISSYRRCTSDWCRQLAAHTYTTLLDMYTRICAKSRMLKLTLPKLSYVAYSFNS